MSVLKLGQAILDFFYPVGIYIETSDINFNPNTLYNSADGNLSSTWVEDTQGEVLVSRKPNDDMFGIVGNSVGSKYLQDHYHLFKVVKDFYGSSGGGLPKGNDPTGANSGWSNFAGANQNNNSVGSVADLQTGNSGNVQPSKVIIRWHRTA